MKYCPSCGHKNSSSLASNCEACESSLSPKITTVTYTPKKAADNRLPKSSRTRNQQAKDYDDDDEEFEDDDFSDVEDFSPPSPRRNKEFIDRLSREQIQTVDRTYTLQDLITPRQ